MSVTPKISYNRKITSTGAISYKEGTIELDFIIERRFVVIWKSKSDLNGRFYLELTVGDTKSEKSEKSFTAIVSKAGYVNGNAVGENCYNIATNFVTYNTRDVLQELPDKEFDTFISNARGVHGMAYQHFYGTINAVDDVRYFWALSSIATHAHCQFFRSSRIQFM